MIPTPGSRERSGVTIARTVSCWRLSTTRCISPHHSQRIGGRTFQPPTAGTLAPYDPNLRMDTLTTRDLITMMGARKRLIKDDRQRVEDWQLRAVMMELEQRGVVNRIVNSANRHPDPEKRVLQEARLNLLVCAVLLVEIRVVDRKVSLARGPCNGRPWRETKAPE